MANGGIEFEGTNWEGFTEDFDKAKCHREVQSYDANARRSYTSEKCTEPAVCVVVDQHGYYLGCYCQEHRPNEGEHG